MCVATSPAIDPLVHGAGHISSFNLAPLGGGQGSGSDLLQKGTQRLREASGAQPEGALSRLIGRTPGRASRKWGAVGLGLER